MNKEIDCNFCRYLSVSESEQDKQKAKGIIKPHICLKFRKRVFHNANTKAHNPYLYPCAECVAEMKQKG